jgi:succinate-acetate transporter protein
VFGITLMTFHQRSAFEYEGVLVADTDIDVPRSAVPAVSPSVIGDPGPLGLAAFAMTTFVLSCINTKLLNVGVESIVAGLALFYGGATQLLAGMWEFRQGNTFGATAFSSYGAFWLSYWALAHFFVPTAGVSASDVNHALGVFLLGWTIFTAYMFIASLRITAAIAAVFGALTLTFLLLTLGKFISGSASTLTQIGGWLGLVTAVFAWYASFAVITNTTWKRTIVPVFPLV